MTTLCLAVVAQSHPPAHQPHPAAGDNAKAFDALAAKADAARKAQQLDDAASLYARALQLRPRWTEGWWELGTIYYDTDRYAQAAEAFRKLLALDQKHGTATAMLGLCQFELGQDSEALRNIETGMQIGVSDDAQLRQVVLYHEGVLLQRAGRFDGAQKALSSLCMSGVRSEEVVRTFGLVALRRRDTSAPAAGTSDADIVERLGWGACLAGKKDYDAARQQYQAVLARYPHDPALHDAYGRFLLDAKDRDAAIAEFQQEIADAPNSVLPRLHIAAAHYKIDSAAGLSYAQDAVRLAPQMPFAHYLLGLLLLDTGDYAASIPHLEIARSAFPEEPKLFWSLGVAYAHAGRPQDAAHARAEFARLDKAAKGAGEATPPGQTPDAAASGPIIVPDAINAGPRP